MHISSTAAPKLTAAACNYPGLATCWLDLPCNSALVRPPRTSSFTIAQIPSALACLPRPTMRITSTWCTCAARAAALRRNSETYCTTNLLGRRCRSYSTLKRASRRAALS